MLSLTVKKVGAFKFDEVADSDNTVFRSHDEHSNGQNQFIFLERNGLISRSAFGMIFST